MTALPQVNAFQHAKQRLLHEQVRRDPGINFRELVRQSRLPRGTAQHHVGVLVRLGLLVERRGR